MDKNIFTYLIGAGASIQSIPTVAGFKGGLEDFHDNLRIKYSLADEPFSYKNFPKIAVSKKEAMDVFLADLTWLFNEIQNHSSIDTYARILYLTKNEYLLRKLKAVIDIYLTATQLFNGIDLRYETFLATILNGSATEDIELPKNIRILSWNYDFQFELACSMFFRKNTIEEIAKILQTFPNLNYENYFRDRFFIFKLNGTTSGYSSDSKQSEVNRLEFDTSKIKDNLKEDEKKHVVEFLMLCYHLFTQEGTQTTSTINYAWEDNDSNDITRNTAKQETADTNFLVVIGYSFPTFNRNVDKSILKNMKYLRKVYIQIPEKDIDGVIQRFKTIRPDVAVVPITATDEFFVPFEY
ncbi:MAG: hypothetical protein VR77_05215 [Flavobacteriales bacterium BRH_c54]|nr:MAG: hypothetical protein VR77_05215 [Flavobacteriales bacterium BRH_c54]